MRRIAALALLLASASAAASAETFRVFGSAGSEAQLSPANGASPLNPNNAGDVPYTTNSADAALYADVKPESGRWKLHGKLRADASDRAADHLQLGEGYAQFNAAPWLDITAGRVIEKWGTGYAWNPVAFVSPKKNPADPTDRRSSYRGLDMLRADVFVRGTTASFYALRDGGVAARAYRLIGGTDVSLHFRRDGSGTQQGISAARVFGEALELHGEAARRHLLLGGQYTFASNVNVVAELYHGGDGMSASDWRSFSDSVENGDATTIRAANARFVPLMMARNYGFVRLDWAPPESKLELELIAIRNLRDRSSLTRATLTRKLRSNVSLYVIESDFFGSADSEFAYVQVRRLTTFGARVYF